MTDFDDELASAYLDDAVSGDERARVEGDPAVLARVEDLRAARDALAASVAEPPNAIARETAIRAALDASSTVDLAAARARRRVRIASVAAVALVVLGAAGILVRSLRDTSSSPASTAAAARSSSSSAASPPAERTAGAASPSTAATLGTFSGRAALVAAVETTTSASATPSAADATPPQNAPFAGAARCVPTVPATSVDEVLASSAVLDGRPVQVDVFALDDGSRRVVVTASDSCTELFSQAL